MSDDIWVQDTPDGLVVGRVSLDRAFLPHPDAPVVRYTLAPLKEVAHTHQ